MQDKERYKAVTKRAFINRFWIVLFFSTEKYLILRSKHHIIFGIGKQYAFFCKVGKIIVKEEVGIEYCKSSHKHITLKKKNCLTTVLKHLLKHIILKFVPMDVGGIDSLKNFCTYKSIGKFSDTPRNPRTPFWRLLLLGTGTNTDTNTGSWWIKQSK